MQGMLDNLSQPVAFATVPLGNEDSKDSTSYEIKSAEPSRDGNASSDTDADEPIFSKFTRKIGIGREATKSGPPRRSRFSKPSTNTSFDEEEEDFDDFLEEGKILLQSVCVFFDNLASCRG